MAFTVLDRSRGERALGEVLSGTSVVGEVLRGTSVVGEELRGSPSTAASERSGIGGPRCRPVGIAFGPLPIGHPPVRGDGSPSIRTGIPVTGDSMVAFAVLTVVAVKELGVLIPFTTRNGAGPIGLVRPSSVDSPGMVWSWDGEGCIAPTTSAIALA